MILAIDQSLTESGYWLNDNIYGTIKTNSKKYSQIKRIIQIRDEIDKLYKKYNFEILIMEGYSYSSRNTKFTFTAGELGGMIKLWCIDNNIELIIVQPSMIKKFICGKGNVKKEQMLLQIYKKFNIEFDNNNIADAYAIWKFYNQYLNWCVLGDGKFKVYEIECFKKFKENEK